MLRVLLIALSLPALCLGKARKRVSQKGKTTHHSISDAALVTVNSSVINSDTLVYTVSVNGKEYLQSGAMSFRSNGVQMTNLMMNQSYSDTGNDQVGSFQAEVYEWVDSTLPDKPSVITKIKTYPDSNPNIVVFAQEFPDGLSGTKLGDANGLSSVFPSFASSQDTTNTSTLGWVHFGGFMAAGRDLQHGTFSADGMSEYSGGMDDSGPLCLFRYDLSESVVISPLNQFMAASDLYVQDVNSIQFGVMGNATEYPRGWSMEFILVATNGGINQAMYEWGDEMLRIYNRKRGDSWDRDLTLNFLGYSTDNGAYYYYITEPYKNYQETIIDIADFAKFEGIPYKYILLDSWWYYRGDGNGVANWTSKTNIFPDGLEYVYQQTGLLVQGHNRYFAPDTVYANNNPVPKESGYTGPTFPFIWADGLGIPQTGDFWDALFEMNNDWGLIVYEQDWLSKTLDDMPQLSENVTLGETWLLQMASMAEKHDLSIQYCMSFPRYVLTALQTKSVTQARGSADYHPGMPNRNNWQIGTSGLLLGALGLGNSKDNFWSSQIPQYNHRYNSDGLTQEPWPRLQSACASISNGPVQIGDQLDYSDVSLIMKSCTQEGRLLRSGRNAAPIDRYFVANGFKDGSQPTGPTYWTQSVIDGYPYPYAYVIAANLTDDFYLQTTDVDLDQNGISYLIFESNTTDVFATLDPDSQGYKIASNNDWTFEFLTMIPVDKSISNGWYLQGEYKKWISVSPERFNQIDLNSKGITVQFNGTLNEVVKIGFINLESMERIKVKCTIGSSMSGSAKCSDDECVCLD